MCDKSISCGCLDADVAVKLLRVNAIGNPLVFFLISHVLALAIEPTAWKSNAKYLEHDLSKNTT